jgi:drug/metabolite transporter (DMT)-like permease
LSIQEKSYDFIDFNTSLVALLSGILATGLFFLARNRASKPSELAAIDATQSSEVVFALIGEIILLQAPLPDATAFTGIFLVFSGLILFIRFQNS